VATPLAYLIAFAVNHALAPKFDAIDMKG